MIDSLQNNLIFQPLDFTANVINHFVPPAPDTLTARHDLRYLLEVYAPAYPQSPTFELLTTLEAREAPPKPPFTTSDGVNFVVNSQRRGLIDSLLSTTKPAVQQSAISVITSLCTPYYVVEKIKGGTPVQDTSVTQATRWAYKGGLSAKDFENYRQVFFDKHLAQYRSFLTFQPNEKYIGRNQEEYLYFLLNFSPLPEEVRLRVKVHLKDGSSLPATTAKTISRVVSNAVLCVPVGPQTLDLPENVEYYEVWLSNQANDRLTEIRSYYIDPAVYESETHVLFANSLGVFDTVRFTGQRIDTLRAGKNFYLESSEHANSVKVLSGSFTQDYTLNTGFLGHNIATFTQYLSELIFSSEHYLIADNQHQALVLKPQEYTSRITNNLELLNHQFVFQVARLSENFSILPAQAPQSSRPTSYLAIDLFYLLRADGKRSGYIKGNRLKQIYADTLLDVLPLRIKPNIEGDPDFIPPFFEPSLEGTSPFLSTLISRQGSFKRRTCAPGQIGGYATVVVPAGAFGGETAQAAQLLAEAEFRRLDTQAYADTYGVCNAGPWIYEATVPANYAYFKINIANSSYAANGVTKYNNASNEIKGNGWWAWGDHKSSSDVYPSGKWDILLPTNFGPAMPWNFVIYSAYTRIRIFVNGVSVYDANPARLNGVANISIPHASIPSQSKVYVQID